MAGLKYRTVQGAWSDPDATRAAINRLGLEYEMTLARRGILRSASLPSFVSMPTSRLADNPTSSWSSLPMKNLRCAAVALLLTLPFGSAMADVTEQDITALFDDWNAALQTGQPERVAALYEDMGAGILLPTLSNKVRHDRPEIADYFVHFLAKGPEGRIDEGNVRIYGDVAINSGLYTFTFDDGSAVQARFSFVYRWNGVRWMIVEHHSSGMPES